MIAFLFISGISTKKNVAINASKDFTGSHLWGSSSIPFGGTLPSRGAHGNFTVTFRLFVVVVVVKEVQSNGLLLLTIRHKYSPRWIHAIFLQKRQRLCRSQRASGSFSGDNSIKWAQIWAFFDTQFLKKEFIKGKKHCLQNPLFVFLCCRFRLCNMAVWPEPDEHVCQHAIDQQKHPGSAASPAAADYSWANGLVCQIRTPLVASPLSSDLCPKNCFSPKSRHSRFIIKMCT